MWEGGAGCCWDTAVLDADDGAGGPSPAVVYSVWVFFGVSGAGKCCLVGEWRQGDGKG